MATLQEIYDRMNPKPSQAQWCFIQRYLNGPPAVTGLDYAGHRSTDQVRRDYPISISGQVITGSIDGRYVEIIVGGSDDAIHAMTQQEGGRSGRDGRYEIYETSIFSGARRATLTENAEIRPAFDGRRGIGRYTHASITRDGREVPELLRSWAGIYDPVNARHRELDSYFQGCGAVSSLHLRGRGPTFS